MSNSALTAFESPFITKCVYMFIEIDRHQSKAWRIHTIDTHMIIGSKSNDTYFKLLVFFYFKKLKSSYLNPMNKDAPNASNFNCKNMIW